MESGIYSLDEPRSEESISLVGSNCEINLLLETRR